MVGFRLALVSPKLAIPELECMMTEFDIQAARKRCEAATPGPWKIRAAVNGFDKDVAILDSFGQIIAEVFMQVNREVFRPAVANAAFIKHARSDLPAALEALEEAQGKLEWVKRWMRGEGSKSELYRALSKEGNNATPRSN